MKTKNTPPPKYWFGILLDAISDGDFRSADRARERLKQVGIDVSLRGLIPGSDASETEGRSNG